MVNKHGLVKHELYRKWYCMKRRCYNPNCIEYKHYGARGITVCAEWKDDFMVFYNWAINNGWVKGLQLDRRENDGNYEPGNCRFVTSMVNGNNRRTIILITFNGRTQSASEWGRELGINPFTIMNRFNKGLPAEKIFFKGAFKHGKLKP